MTVNNSQTLNNLLRRYQVTKEIFDHVIDMTKHEDEKAGRIMFSIAFIVAATAAIFGAFLNNHIGFFWRGIDLIPITFLFFIIFIVIGGIFMLYAIGPKYEMPKIWGMTSKSRTSQETYAPKSIFFFEKIAEEDVGKWMSYFEAPIDSILKKACNDHLYEAHLVSKKVKGKVRSIKYARLLFMIAMGLLICITFFGFLGILSNTPVT